MHSNQAIQKQSQSSKDQKIQLGSETRWNSAQQHSWAALILFSSTRSLAGHPLPREEAPHTLRRHSLQELPLAKGTALLHAKGTDWQEEASSSLQQLISQSLATHSTFIQGQGPQKVSVLFNTKTAQAGPCKPPADIGKLGIVQVPRSHSKAKQPAQSILLQPPRALHMAKQQAEHRRSQAFQPGIPHTYRLLRSPELTCTHRPSMGTSRSSLAMRHRQELTGTHSPSQMT